VNIFKTTQPFLIAGPCSAETATQVTEIAWALKDMPINMMRAGVWKPRTKPGGFEGMGKDALPWLQEAKKISGKPICIEVATPEQIELALAYNIDCLWIGARSTVSPFIVQELADALKGINIPLLIKNPVNPDIDLWQGAIERFMNAGITQIGAIHRGFSSYDKTSKYRNKPNWSIPIELKRRMPEMPIICDPSHITGRKDLIAMVSQRAMDLHFDGLMIETHPTPDEAWSDAKQQITPDVLRQIIEALKMPAANSTNNSAQQQLEDLRQMIDSLDAEVVDLIAKRMSLVEQIAMVKQEHQISVFQPERWYEIINNRTKQGEPLQLNEAFILKLFEIIHDKSIKTQFEVMQKNKTS
jgi:chorismate mutase